MNQLFVDYEQVLLGNEKSVGSYHFYGSDPGGMNQKIALSCIKYCLEEVLNWTIDDCRKKFDDYTIHLMKLDHLINYIIFPPELEIGNPKYILSLLYPSEIHMNQKEMIEKMYQRILDGKGQFPREYFLGQEGFYRFCVCLCYMIRRYCPFYTLEELYALFAGPNCKKYLNEYRLKIPMEHLNIDILKCLYHITSDEEDSKFFLSYYDFKRKIEEDS